MKLERIADALLFVVVILFLAFMAGAFQPYEAEYTILEAKGEITPTKSPGALEQFESVWGAAIELPAPKPAPDTWEHWFPTVPKPEDTPTAFELLAEKVFAFGRKMLATYREGLEDE